jgi:predicted TIM-barrel fold metal-dependent hydrolase
MGSGPASILIDGMNASGIDKAIVFGENEFVAESAKKYPDRLVPFYYFNPRNEDIQFEELEKHARDYGWKGVKVGHESAVARSMYEMLEIAEKYNLIFVMHSGHGNEFHPYIIGDLANSFPKVRTVLLHMGGGMCLDLELVSTKIAEKNPNIYLETCYAHPYAIEQAIKTLGPERVLFGSDASNNGYASHYEKPGLYQEVHLNAIRLIQLPEDKEKIVLGGAAKKLLEG